MTAEPVRVEATGDTVGEARWAALHELERRFPGLDRDAVEFQVVSEGARGLLGVGYEAARVVAVLPEAPPARPQVDHPEESPAAAGVRRLLDQVLASLGIQGQIRIAETGEAVEATVTGPDLGLLIGRHGQTIDALQYLANAMMHRRGEGLEVIVDAQGYRERRARALHETALKAAAEVRRTGQPVELEPMTSVERKIVHVRLKELGGVATASEGIEPNRHIVVHPEPPSGPA
jgi:spoIIIJ-associated protein